MVNKRRFQSLSYSAVEGWGSWFVLSLPLSVFIFILAHLMPEEYVLHVFLFFSFLPSSLSSL